MPTSKTLPLFVLIRDGEYLSNTGVPRSNAEWLDSNDVDNDLDDL